VIRDEFVLEVFGRVVFVQPIGDECGVVEALAC
jgi:hypothetical protein